MATAGSDPDLARPAAPRLVLFILWLLVFSAASQTMIVAPILPRLGEALSVRTGLLGTLVGVYSLMVGVVAVLCGPVSDRIGRRRILLLGSGLMTLAMFLHGLPGSYLSFLAVRILAGIAGGVLSGAAVSYIGDLFPYARRGWAIGWVMSGSAFGQVAGLPAGVVLAHRFGVAAPFFAFGVTMAVTFGLVLIHLPQPVVRRSRRPLTLRHAVDAYRSLVSRSEVRAAASGFFLMSFGVAAYLVYLPTWLERVRGADGGDIAWLFLVGGVASVLGGPWAGSLSDRLGRRTVILGACALLSVAMVATPVGATSLAAIFPLFFATMLFVTMRQSPYSALLTGLVRSPRRGTLLSLSVALGQLGFALGSTLAGPLYSVFGYASTAAVAAGSVVVMAVVVGRWVPEVGEREEAVVGGIVEVA